MTRGCTTASIVITQIVSTSISTPWIYCSRSRTPPVEGETEKDLAEYEAKYINETTRLKLKTYFRFEDIQLYLSWAPWSTCHGCKGQPGQMWRMGTLRQRNVDFEQEDVDELTRHRFPFRTRPAWQLALCTSSCTRNS